jgi:small conductance mechanosensitive channel
LLYPYGLTRKTHAKSVVYYLKEMRRMNNFLKTFNLSFSIFLDYLPAILGGIVCFIITIFIANFSGKLASKYSVKRTKDGLIANFIGKIVWSVIFILGTVLALGILGLGTISNKILAGAGITTFVIGFALKDIGENFLAGLILAFSRPYREGSLIECDGIKGVVRNMTMRQTTVEAENGKIILIPNSAIINNPLTKYMNSDYNLRQEFAISVDLAGVRKAVKIITETVSSFDSVMKGEEKPVKVSVNSLNADKTKLTVVFWFDTSRLESSKSDARSDIMLEVFDRLRKEDIKFSG